MSRRAKDMATEATAKQNSKSSSDETISLAVISFDFKQPMILQQEVLAQTSDSR